MGEPSEHCQAVLVRVLDCADAVASDIIGEANPVSTVRQYWFVFWTVLMQ